MHDHERSETRAKPQGIGARVLRKEDARHLLGKGNFVADISMPGLCEVAFLRSPVAHATISHINIPEQHASSIFTRPMLDALDITADSTLPTYQPSAQPPLAHDKVRYVGEPVVKTTAASRAEAEDLLE
jgi:carbon-monoxide dehydrogenase large subunit